MSMIFLSMTVPLSLVLDETHEEASETACRNATADGCRHKSGSKRFLLLSANGANVRFDLTLA